MWQDNIMRNCVDEVHGFDDTREGVRDIGVLLGETQFHNHRDTG